MKILHVVPSYLPAWRYGGPIRSVHGLARAQAAAGDSVEVYTTDADGPDRLDVPNNRAVDLDGVNVRYFPCRSPRRLYRSPSLGRALDAVAEFDLVHLHSVFLWPTLAAARRAHAAQVPYVVSPRGMLIEDLIEARGELRKRLWILLFERRTLAHSAAILATSPYEAEELRKLNLDFGRVEVVPNGVALDSGESDFGGSAASDEFVAGGPFFLFLGRLAAKKALDLLLAAVAATREVRLVIAGGDDEDLRKQLEPTLATLGLIGRVHFAGEVRGAPKLRLLRQCRALVLVSTSENFGNVVLEALAAGRPVVVTRTVGLATAVGAQEAGRIVERNVASIAVALEELLRNPRQADEMGMRGRQWVEVELSWEAVARQHRAIYARCIEAHGTRARGRVSAGEGRG